MSDADYSQGSIDTANIIIGWLGKVYGPTIQRAAIVAWEAGDMFPPAPKASERPKMSREQARGSGYTGDQCAICSSMRMKRNGSCMVCEECGQTTGCS